MNKNKFLFLILGTLTFAALFCACEYIPSESSSIQSSNSSEVISSSSHIHSWTKGNIENPTCTQKGKINYSCFECGQTKYDIIDELGHKIVVEKEIPATCNSIGVSEGKYCSVCNEVIVKQNVIEKLQHNYEYFYDENYHWKVCSNNDCNNTTSKEKHKGGEATETKKAICEDCGVSYGNLKPHIHSYVNEIADEKYLYSSEDCVNKAKYFKSCSCGATSDSFFEYGEALGHSYKEYLTDATCYLPKTQVKYCTRDNCNYSETKEIGPALGHDWKYVGNDKEHWKECNRCTAVTVDKILHSGGQATETQKAVCEICNLEYGYLMPHIHDFCFELISNKYLYENASCTDPARYHKSCRCGAKGDLFIVGEPLGHNFGEWKQLEPETCLSDLEEKRICERCYCYETKVVGPALGHQAVIDEEIKPTCTKEGLTEGSHCNKCQEILIKQMVVPASGHQKSTAKEENRVESTCIKQGEYNIVYYCDVCNVETSREKILLDLIPHMGEKIWGFDPTCTTEGYSGDTLCDMCNEIIPDGEIIPSLGGHKLVLVEGYPATCEDDGLSDGYYCSTCYETIEEQTVIKSKGVHEFLDGKCVSCNCDYYSQELKFILSDDGTYYLDVSSEIQEQNIVIPSIYKGKAVTGIVDRAFADCVNILSIDIPMSITYIGDYVFSGCSSLIEVNLPSNLTYISEGMFSDCYSLKKIVFHENIEEIGAFSFQNCTSLEKVDIPNSVNYIGYYSFYACSLLSHVSLPNKKINYDGYVFGGCKSLKTINIPNSLEVITKGMFNGAGLVEIEIPSSVVEIEDNVFAGCELSNVNIPSSVKKIGSYSFGGCHQLESVKLNNGIEYIDDSAFSRCISLKSINLPTTIAYIGEATFFECISLEEIVLPNTIEEIKGVTFYSCSSLKNIEIPQSVQRICFNAFEGCIALENIVIPDNVTTIDAAAFTNCTSLKTVILSDNMTEIFYYLFNGCTSLESVTISSKVTYVYTGAFYNCNNLKTVNFKGTQSQWNIITFEVGNDSIKKANKIYNYKN